MDVDTPFPALNNRCGNNPDFTCLDLYDYQKDEDGTYYGNPSSRLGTPDVIQLKAAGSLKTRSLTHSTSPGKYLLRFFVKNAALNPGSATLQITLNGRSYKRAVLSGGFQPVEVEFDLSQQTSNLPVVLTNLSSSPLTLDGMILHKELPGFGLDGDGLPVFPSDPDERALGWRYCGDDFLLELP